MKKVFIEALRVGLCVSIPGFAGIAFWYGSADPLTPFISVFGLVCLIGSVLVGLEIYAISMIWSRDRRILREERDASRLELKRVSLFKLILREQMCRAIEILPNHPQFHGYLERDGDAGEEDVSELQTRLVMVQGQVLDELIQQRRENLGQHMEQVKASDRIRDLEEQVEMLKVENQKLEAQPVMARAAMHCASHLAQGIMQCSMELLTRDQWEGKGKPEPNDPNVLSNVWAQQQRTKMLVRTLEELNALELKAEEEYGSEQHLFKYVIPRLLNTPYWELFDSVLKQLEDKLKPGQRITDRRWGKSLIWLVENGRAGNML